MYLKLILGFETQPKFQREPLKRNWPKGTNREAVMEAYSRERHPRDGWML